MHWNGELASSYVNVAAILLEMLLKKKKLQCLIPWTYSRKGPLRRQEGGWVSQVSGFCGSLLQV